MRSRYCTALDTLLATSSVPPRDVQSWQIGLVREVMTYREGRGGGHTRGAR